jgi:hypothetical protein
VRQTSRSTGVFCERPVVQFRRPTHPWLRIRFSGDLIRNILLHHASVSKEPYLVRIENTVFSRGLRWAMVCFI